ncbi:MAG: signal peptidase II [Chromatiales bacterium]|nr:signal peptidase II [Chromatiales bacterium]
MKVIWVSIAVFLLDQVSKYTLQFSSLEERVSIVGESLILSVKPHSSITIEQLRLALLESNSWILLIALITLPLLISRWNALFHFITFRTLLSLQLITGGAISYTFDYLLRGTFRSPIEIHLLQAFTLKASVADLALISGFVLLIYILLSGGIRHRNTIALKQDSPPSLNLSSLPRGVDNIHIDVHLSPAFIRKLHMTIQLATDLVIENILNRRPPSATPGGIFSDVAKTFEQLHRDALKRAKTKGQPQQLDLLYTALLKLTHAEVTNCVVTHIRDAKDTLQDHHRRGKSATHHNQHVAELFRQKDLIINSVNQVIFDGLVTQHYQHLYKSMKGALGTSRTFALDAIRAPLVTCNSADSAAVQFSHYILFGHNKYHAMSFTEIDRVLDDLLHDYLPLIESENNSQLKERHHEASNSDAVATLARPSVLAHTDNITALFNQNWTREMLAKRHPLREWRSYSNLRSHLHFQQRLSEKLIAGFHKAGIAKWIAASYESRKILNRYNPEIPPAILVAQLLEAKNLKELELRIRQSKVSAGVQPLLPEIAKSWTAINKDTDTLLTQYLHTFLRDFSRYRYDLQLLYKYQYAANEIAIVHDEKSLHTSRSNFILHEFLLPDELQHDQEVIQSHIIIKADLRGSTEVTDRLNKMSLNPATHFDRNFFTPINEVIEEYGAEKVFIEGDAIILIINDYAGSHSHLIASRACGLAAGILRVVAKQNKELLCYGLPTLELGIGIAYCNESPRFLFDGDHRITISPAINRADRLSACTWSVRNWRERGKAPAAHVEVYQPSPRALGHGEKAQKDMVYNLNGILIEPEIFALLQKEISPKRIVNRLPLMHGSRLFAIKITDNSGHSSSLVIRRAPVKVFDPAYTHKECPVVEGRVFYEVIHDEAIIDSLRARPAAKTTSPYDRAS